MNLLRPELLDRLARDHALGVLIGGARRRFERLLREQPAAREALRRWQDDVGTLDVGIPSLAPSPALWQRIDQRLFSERPAPRERWWSSWFSTRTLGGALAGALLCAVLLRSQPGLIGAEPATDGLPASYVGLLHDDAGKPTLLASSRRHGQVLTVKMLRPLAVPEGQVARLWALPADGSAPFAVAVLPAPGKTGSTTVTLSAASETLFFKVSRLGVGLEPAGAAPSAQPPGNYVLIGDCVKLW